MPVSRPWQGHEIAGFPEAAARRMDELIGRYTLRTPRREYAGTEKIHSLLLYG